MNKRQNGKEATDSFFAQGRHEPITPEVDRGENSFLKKTDMLQERRNFPEHHIIFLNERCSVEGICDLFLNRIYDC